MNKKHISFISIILSLFIIGLLFSSSTLLACSGFIVRQDGNVLIAHNKDWHNPEVTMYVYPSDEDSHARLFLEIPFPHPFNRNYRVLAGGINDQGLCYESFVTPFNLASFKPFKPPLFENPVDDLLQKYSTVEEIITYIESHNLFFLNYILACGQIFVIDQSGDAAIIEGDDIIRIQRDYQICTNFLQSDPSLGNYPCWRYEYLNNMLQNNSTLSVSYFKSLLEHVQIFPQYSWIFNPQNFTLYLYHFHDYNHTIRFDLNEEFNQPAHSYDLTSLFEPVDNKAPEKPILPTSPTNGRVKEKIVFKTNTTDPDNQPDAIYYQWDFGDNSEPFWTYNYQTYRGTISHQYSKPGNYQVRVKAKDVYGMESPWSDPIEIKISWIKNMVMLKTLLEDYL
jgi:hypothetical protein